eukprot:8823292-Pyramimonas_sp.AAC.1
MCSWLEKTFTWARARSSVFWGFDLNDSLGLRRQPGGVFEHLQSRALDHFGRSEQRFAGDRVLEILEIYALRAVSMDFPVEDTHYGHASSSPIDYVA